MMGVYEMTKGERRAVPEKKQQDLPVKPFGQFDQLLRGGMSTTFVVVATAPPERIKQLLQVERYKNPIDAVMRVPKEQGGVSAFYRGNLANVLRTVYTIPIGLAVNDTYKKFFLEGLDKKKDSWKFYTGSFALSGVAGVTSQCFVYPLDYAYTRLAADIGTGKGREFKGIADCLIKTVKSDGPFGLYRGFFVGAPGVFITRATLFSSIDWFWRSNGDNNKIFSTWKICAAYSVSMALAYPFDTVQRRMMMQSGRKEVLYKGALDCSQKIIKNEGMGGLFKGMMLGQAVPLIAAMYICQSSLLPPHLRY